MMKKLFILLFLTIPPGGRIAEPSTASGTGPGMSVIDTQSQDQTPQHIYDTNGRQRTHMMRGINIVNGKKVVIN